MSNKTVRELAEVVGIPLDRLLEQLAEAGLKVNNPDEIVDMVIIINPLTQKIKKSSSISAGGINASRY